ncbi:MAG: hypothetical protein JSU65_09615 [Candidatus Zixiibacteriota bacterium]|nr:MAG: hypothetical protein JSU65_09615 [candidate division Zixibacteria bacterium]
MQDRHEGTEGHVPQETEVHLPEVQAGAVSAEIAKTKMTWTGLYNYLQNSKQPVEYFSVTEIY